MHKIVMIGVILLAMYSCKPVTIKKPVRMYAINTEFYEAGTGMKNLNIRSSHRNVGEWISDVDFIPLNEAPENMMCFSLETWLKLIKPKLKEGAKQYRDSR